MTLAEAEKKFCISIDALKQYVSFGFIQAKQSENGVEDYREQDFEHLGLIKTLSGAGFSTEEIKRFLFLTENTGTNEEQIYMLRKHRCSLLENIHEKQQLLDQLDFMIWNKKKQGGSL